jgi:hypothetical protein
MLSLSIGAVDDLFINDEKTADIRQSIEQNRSLMLEGIVRILHLPFVYHSCTNSCPCCDI